MKRKILYGFVSLVLVIGVTGCGKTEEKTETSINLAKGKFSIVCSANDIQYDGIKQEIETTYNFNDDQYVINYATVTTQKFEDKSVYKTYKDAQEESVKDNSVDNVSYDLKSDDKTKTLIFTMAVSNIDVNNAESEEEKDRLKASSVLKSIEEATDATYTCKVDGIDRSELK